MTARELTTSAQLTQSTESTRATISTFWTATDARDWERLRATMAPDVSYECPQSREHANSADAIVRFFAEYPGDWRIRITHLIAEDHAAASKIDFDGDNGVETGITFFELDDDGRITSITDTWPEPFEPPFDRSHLVQRY